MTRLVLLSLVDVQGNTAEFSRLMSGLKSKSQALQKSLAPLSKEIDAVLEYHDEQLFTKDDSEINFVPEVTLMKETIGLITVMTKVIESFVDFVETNIIQEGLLRVDDSSEDLSETVKLFSQEATKIAKDFRALSEHCCNSISQSTLVEIVTALARKLLHQPQINKKLLESSESVKFDWASPNPYRIYKFSSLERALSNFLKRADDLKNDDLNPEILFSKLTGLFALFSVPSDDQASNPSADTKTFPEFFQAARAVTNKLTQLWLNLSTNLIKYSEAADNLNYTKINGVAKVIKSSRSIARNLASLHSLQQYAYRRSSRISETDLNEYNWDLNDPKCREYILKQIS